MSKVGAKEAGRRAMTLAQPESPVTAGVRSLEVRWIFPSQADAAVAEWFARFPAEVESRADTYLVNPVLSGLSVKIRGIGPLEVKVYRGTPGILDVPGRARGRMESWQKWSFPFSSLSQSRAVPAGWLPVHKRIRRFSLTNGQVLPRTARPVGEPRCLAELTRVRLRGQAWWTVGFEATGPVGLLRSELEAAAAVMFAEALPGGIEPGLDDSRSYGEWLGRQPGIENDSDARS